MNTKELFLLTGGLFAGAAVGAAIGVLLAPESGEDTRRRIEDGVTDLYYDTYDKAVVLSDKLAEQIKILNETINDQVAKLKGEEATPVEEEGEVVDEGAVAEADDAVEEAEAEAEEPVEEAVEA